MWDCNGLEFCVDVTQDEQQLIWQSLKTGSVSQSKIPNLNHLILRAKFNPQRCYEIYTVDAVAGVTSNDIYDMFKFDPQNSADRVRQIGHQIYSDRLSTNTRVIV